MDGNDTERSGFDELLGYLVNRLPEIRDGSVADDAELFRRVFDLLPLPLRIQDESGITRECNTAFTRLVGRPRSELIGQDSFRYIPRCAASQLELARRTVRAELTRNCRVNANIQLLDAEGNAIDVVFVARPMKVKDGYWVVGVYWPRDELATAVDSPNILSFSGTESGSMAN
jgi:PAS domain S-box-containing protein